MQRLRGKRVAQMMIDLEAEGVAISVTDEAMLSAYVRGVVSGEDLLAHTAQFCDLSSYQKWLYSRFEGYYPSRSSAISVEQVVAEVALNLRHKSVETAASVSQFPWTYQAMAGVLKPFRSGRRVPPIIGFVDPASVTAQSFQPELDHAP